MGEVIRFIPSSERERAHRIQEARAIYNSIFPPADPVSEQPDKALANHTVGGANAYRSDGVLPAEPLEAFLKDLRPKQGSEVLLLVSGFGATPLIELYLMVNSAKRILDGAGITATRLLTGSYVTALDMAGVSVTVSVLDGHAKNLWMRRCTRPRCAGVPDLF